MERRVSTYIREQPFLWIDVDYKPSADSERAYIEQNAIALLSNYQTETLDGRSDGWLGQYSMSQKIRESGLWNVNHVEEQYDPAFLDRLAIALEQTEPL